MHRSLGVGSVVLSEFSILRSIARTRTGSDLQVAAAAQQRSGSGRNMFAEVLKFRSAAERFRQELLEQLAGALGVAAR